jgi:hypothetical protein
MILSLIIGGMCLENLDMTGEETQGLDKVDRLRDVTAVARECGLTEFETGKFSMWCTKYPGENRRFPQRLGGFSNCTPM